MLVIINEYTSKLLKGIIGSDEVSFPSLRLLESCKVVL